jgi:hypothetical protein
LVGSFVRRVTTASGATAVQIVHKRGRRVVGIDHIGSAHDDDRLALLLETAKQRLHVDQQALNLDLVPPRPADRGAPVVDATGSLILWDALCGLYEALGFDAVADRRFGRWCWGGSSSRPASWTPSGSSTSSGSPRRRG